MMRDAGYPGGKGFPREALVVRNTAIEVLQAQAIQAMAKSTLGIDLRIDALEPAAFRSFIEKYFRMARGNHLAALRFGCFGQDLIDLPLPQDLEVGIRLVE
jgi:hypothetical protein